MGSIVQHICWSTLFPVSSGIALCLHRQKWWGVVWSECDLVCVGPNVSFPVGRLIHRHLTRFTHTHDFMYTDMQRHVCTHSFTQMRICSHMLMDIHRHAHTYTHEYKYTHTHTCTHSHAQTCMHTYTHKCLHTHTHTRTHARARFWLFHYWIHEIKTPFSWQFLIPKFPFSFDTICYLLWIFTLIPAAVQCSWVWNFSIWLKCFASNVWFCFFFCYNGHLSSLEATLDKSLNYKKQSIVLWQFLLKKVPSFFIIMKIMIALKGAIQIFLQSPHCNTNFPQHVRSSGLGANHVQHIGCSAHATCCVPCGMQVQSSS